MAALAEFKRKVMLLLPFRDCNGKTCHNAVQQVYLRDGGTIPIANELAAMQQTVSQAAAASQFLQSNPKNASGNPGPRVWIVKPGWFTAKYGYCKVKDTGDDTRRWRLFQAVCAYSHFKIDCEQIYEGTSPPTKVTWKKTDPDIVWAAKRMVRHINHCASANIKKKVLPPGVRNLPEDGSAAWYMRQDCAWLKATFYRMNSARQQALMDADVSITTEIENSSATLSPLKLYFDEAVAGNWLNLNGLNLNGLNLNGLNAGGAGLNNFSMFNELPFNAAGAAQSNNNLGWMFPGGVVPTNWNRTNPVLPTGRAASSSGTTTNTNTNTTSRGARGARGGGNVARPNRANSAGPAPRTRR
jgi:hypothetical protein